MNLKSNNFYNLLVYSILFENLDEFLHAVNFEMKRLTEGLNDDIKLNQSWKTKDLGVNLLLVDLLKDGFSFVRVKILESWLIHQKLIKLKS